MYITDQYGSIQRISKRMKKKTDKLDVKSTLQLFL